MVTNLKVFGFMMAFVLGPISGKGSVLRFSDTFVATNQNMWGPGPAESFNQTDSIFGPKTWDLNGDVYGLTGHTSGSVGLGYNLQYTFGSVNIRYPIGVTLVIPDTVRRGDMFEIASSYSVLPGASLTTESPNGSFSLTGNLALEADVGISHVGSLTLIDRTFFDGTLFTISSSSDSGFTLSGPLGSTLSGNFPTIKTSGTLSDGRLISSGADTFLTASDDIAAAVAEAFALPPPSGTIDLGIGTINYNLLKLILGMTFTAQQNFTFTPTPILTLMVNGTPYSAPVGTPIDILFPANMSSLTISPSVSLDNEFQNVSGLKVGGDVFTSALEASAHVRVSLGTHFGFCICHTFNFGPLGPVFTEDFPFDIGAFDIFDKTFPLAFSHISDDPFTIEARPVPRLLTSDNGGFEPDQIQTPEPVNVLLVATGLFAMGVVRRRLQPKIDVGISA